MRKPDFCIGEYKVADQLRSNCEADQRLCFRYTDSTISLLILSFFNTPAPTISFGISMKFTAVGQLAIFGHNMDGYFGECAIVGTIQDSMTAGDKRVQY